MAEGLSGASAASIAKAMELHRSGATAEAEAMCRGLLSARPDDADALRLLGVLCHQSGRQNEACKLYRRAVEINPGLAEAWNDMGACYAAAGEVTAAIEAYGRAIALRADYREALSNLGAALCDAARPREAVAILERALELDPGDAEVHLRMASALRDAGDLDAAVRSARESLRIRPDSVNGRYILAITHLLQGDLRNGWRDAEAIWQSRVHRAEYPLTLMWNGSDPAGRRILLHADHGFGDTIQFARYAPLLAGAGARVSIRCQPEVRRLLSRLERVEQVVGNDEPAPAFDLHCPLIGLPRVFGTTIQTIPAEIGYLKAEAGASAKWRRRLSEEPGGLKVGLAWAGSPAFREDRFRSPHLAAFAPLAGIGGVRFYSLQKGPAGAEVGSAPAGLTIVDWTGELHDFDDTAALIDSLDLVVSSDTGVVHLAGALGKPVWVLLHYAPGFFWMLEREDSPWYPTMRLLRQVKPGDWEPVMRRAARELAVFARERMG